MKHKILIWTLLIVTLLIVGCSSQTQNRPDGNLQNTQNNLNEIDNNGFSNFVPLEYKGTSEDFMIENLGKDVFDKYVSVVKDEECTDNGEPECYVGFYYVFDEQKSPELRDGNGVGTFAELYDRKTGKFIKFQQSRIDTSTDKPMFIPGGQIHFTKKIIDVICQEDSALQICDDFPKLKKIHAEQKYEDNSDEELTGFSLSVGGFYSIGMSSDETKQYGKSKLIYVEKASMKVLQIDEGGWVID